MSNANNTLPNFSSQHIPLPGELVQPPQGLFVVTVGHKVGIMQHVHDIDIMTLLTVPKFSITPFLDWDAAKKFYTDEFRAGRVSLVKPGGLLSTPKIIQTSAKLLASGEILSGLGTKEDPLAISSPQKRQKAVSYYPVKASTSTAATRIRRGPSTRRWKVVGDEEDGQILERNGGDSASGSGCGSAGATHEEGSWLSVANVSIRLAEERVDAKVGRTSNISKASASNASGKESDEQSGENHDDEMEE